MIVTQDGFTEIITLKSNRHIMRHNQWGSQRAIRLVMDACDFSDLQQIQTFM
jgi:hypothetical protein